jgi:hypothetical protein
VLVPGISVIFDVLDPGFSVSKDVLGTRISEVTDECDAEISVSVDVICRNVIASCKFEPSATELSTLCELPDVIVSTVFNSLGAGTCMQSFCNIILTSSLLI